MDQTGMWNLFFATGLPEAYLAAQAERQRQGKAIPPSPPEQTQTGHVPSMEG